MLISDDRQLIESRRLEIESLQHKVSNLRSDLKVEMKRAKQSSENQVGTYFHMPWLSTLFFWEMLLRSETLVKTY
jgi:hypothetical protein